MSYLPIKSGLHDILDDIATTFHRFPQTEPARPYITYRGLDANRDTTFKGHSGIVNKRISISVFDDSPEGCERVARLVRLALLNVRNTTWGDHLVFGMRLDNEVDIDDHDTSTKGEEGLYSIVLDYIVTYREDASS